MREEEEDTNRRRNNVVIHNIPEPREGSAKERLDKDKQVCTKLFETSLRLEKTVQEGKNRPVLLVLKSEEEKREVLRRAKNLKHQRDPIKKSL